MTLDEIKRLHESEDKVEFKEALNQYNYQTGRRSVIGYVVALANEGGGKLILGVRENRNGLHYITGTVAWQGQEGKLTEDIYRDQQIRVETEILFDGSSRVLVIHIPSRPIGKTLKFEDVPLMRVGEDLLPMSDDQLFKILQEQEPDFSTKICDGLTVGDLDEGAIKKMKEAYSRKQENPLFLTQSNAQCLIDLNLMINGKLTNAALILLGKTEAIKQNLPQSTICLEYRNSSTQITFDNRQIITEPYFLAIDNIWEIVNLRNGKVPVQEGPYIFDIHFFNKEVIREALNNAVAHRDYRRTSEVVIKQFPHEIHFINPGGFPLGVTLQNLLTVNSTPRNRLLTDVLAKTGIVERSGQGIDKIYYQCLSEAKPEPDYTRSDDYQVELRISGFVEDKAFALFIKQIQNERIENEKLSVHEIITLNCLRKGLSKEKLDSAILKKLVKEGLIESVGKTKAHHFILSKEYFAFTGKEGEYSNEKPFEERQAQLLINQHFLEFKKAKMKDFVQLLSKVMTREQIKYTIYGLVKQGILDKSGEGTATEYSLGKKMEERQKVFTRAIQLGLEEMKTRGELSKD